MPLRYLQLRGQDPNYDLVSLRGLYSPENSLVGKALVEELDVDDWDNWMRWDLGTTGLLTPEEEAKDNTAGNLPSPGAYFSDLEFPVNDEAPSSAVTERGMTIEDVLIDIDEDTESLLFSPTSSTGSMFLRDLHQPVDPTSLLPVANGKFLAVEDPEVVSRQPTSASGTKAARSKLSRPLQVDTPSRGTRKRRASKDDTELNSPCLSKKRGHNAIEKRYRTNLNEKINCLRDALPTASKSNMDTKAGEDDSDEEDVENKSGQQKFGKAAILTRALEYIKHLERSTQKLGAEIDLLKSRVGAFERLAMSGKSAGNEGDIPTLITPTKGLTLESIQEEFKQIKAKPSRSRSTSESALPCKRTKRQSNIC